MSGKAYLGTLKRSFPQALTHLLETQYGLVGSHKVVDLLVEDVQRLVAAYFPAPERLQPGWLLFTGVKASGGKAYPGQSGADHELVTLAWPVLLPEDVQGLARGFANVTARQEWFRDRLVRLVEWGARHPEGPVLLTLADLGAMLGLDTVKVSQLLEQARQSTGQPLLTKGYYYDQGMRPTHKARVVELYEQGYDEVTIARMSQHGQSSVGRYVRDYERVKLLSQRGIPAQEMMRLLDMQPNVVKTYLSFVEKYHPQLDKPDN